MKIMSWLLFIPALVFAQSSKYADIEKYADKQSEINRFGGTVIVVKNDTVILNKAYGFADMEWEVKNTPDTKFVLASITKYFTAIAVMQLVESGKLALDDKLSKYFPKYPKGDSVTVHMMLTHTAGLQLDFDELYMNSTVISKDSAVAELQRKPYLFEPGTNCKYSNIGYFLLSQIIEKASGNSYADYLQQHIFDKVGMHDTGVSNNDSIISRKAKIYYRNGSGYAHNPYINWNLNVGLDGIYSTTGDLYKLDRAMYGTVLLSSESKKKMESQYNKKFPDNGFIDSYGYGIFINPYYNHGHQMLTHSGGFIGTMTTFDRYPGDNVFIAVLSNNESESHMISYGLAGILFDIPVVMPYEHKQVPVDAKIVRSYAGKYGNFEVLYNDGKLYYNNLDTELLAESDTKFFNKINHDRTFEFVSDKRGNTKAVIVTKGGVSETKLIKR